MAQASITWISGPVLRARAAGPFFIKEAVLVGDQRLLGEVIRIDGNDIVAQVYEDTSGLRPGVSLHGSGRPLYVNLGPALLGQIFDGLLRPLSGTDSNYVQPGMRRAPPISFPFVPEVEVGQSLKGGDAFGRVEPPDRRPQSCLVPPQIAGRVVAVAASGERLDSDIVCTLEDAAGNRWPLAMTHPWPIRAPRPFRERLPAAEPLVTGQRILDSLFPVARGGKAALPGGFGTGKTVLQETLAKSCDADIIVYAGCGERGNEMATLLEEFPQLEDPRSGRPLLERTVVIANTSNMPVAAREASIYTAVTVAEYFRDQGLDVALMADSTSRWAEALREVSGRLGELPGESGYPAYLGSRLAEFYERAARVRTLSDKEGSVTIIGAVSPPSGDFSEPVVTHTRRYVRCYWALDPVRAHARFFPAVNPLLSYSSDSEKMIPWWQAAGNPDWATLRARFLTLLEEQARLERMARIIGKDALPPRQRLTLLCAELINNGFLSQNAYSPTDRSASPQRQSAMMRVLARFFDLAARTIGAPQVSVAAAEAEKPLAAAPLEPEKLATLPIYRRLQRMGEEIPDDQLERFDDLHAQLEAELAPLLGRPADEH